MKWKKRLPAYWVVRIRKYILVLFCLLFIACQKTITEEEAIGITHDFINNEVRFFVNDNETNPVVEQAKITLLKTEKADDVYMIYINVQSNHTGEIKQSDLVVSIDAIDGNILNMQKFQ